MLIILILIILIIIYAVPLKPLATFTNSQEFVLKEIFSIKEITEELKQDELLDTLEEDTDSVDIDIKQI